MTLIYECPDCGEVIRIEDNAVSAYCEGCDSVLLVDELVVYDDDDDDEFDPDYDPDEDFSYVFIPPDDDDDYDPDADWKSEVRHP